MSFGPVHGGVADLRVAVASLGRVRVVEDASGCGYARRRAVVSRIAPIC